ncbi:hypothetical protein [Nocardia carnea]|uniref:hypothetical protein n=1 Tax=Nocardia carnea TaxID=37328 RepID=UPI002458BDBC|nr:hypothetical protein [Nocardia carnea]
MGTDSGVSAKAAVELTEEYVKATIETMSQWRSKPAFGRTIDELRWGITRGGVEEAQQVRELLAEMNMVLGEEFTSQLGVIVYTAEAARLWRQHRVIYRVHPRLADALTETETSAAVPCEVFTRLPHPNPFVVFPTPLPAPAAADPPTPIAVPPVFLGMLVTGMTEHDQLCSTADPAARYLYISLATKLRYEGSEDAYEETTRIVPLTGTRTVDDLIALNTAFGGGPGDMSKEGNQRVHSLALSLLLYLCSDRSDIREHRPPAPAGRRGRKARRQKDRPVVDMGFEIGPSLEAASRSPNSESGVGAAGTGTVRAHLRRAHWHTYLTGPRDNPTPEVRWLLPTLVNPGKSSPRPLVVDAAGAGEVNA